MARILGIDYGSKRVGIAVTDPLRIIATALTTVPSHEVMNFLKEYISKEPVDTIVVGEAKDLNDQPTHSTRLIEDFIKGLKKAFPSISIETEDEGFSSKIAMEGMISSGMKKSKRREKGVLDKISAVVILQNYMQRGEIEDK
jgi:putative Holliday junction resolvase